MPETYIEPLTDRQVCYTCKKTVDGKKKLLKCGGCHAITYCGQECQVADRPRHKWNCLPVMVTEIPGKGRGLVAAREIKIGELIFVDKPVITVDSDFETGEPLDDMETFKSILSQFARLPSEAKLQFNSLKVPAECLLFPGDILKIQKFILNSRMHNDNKITSLYLNIALINHSCAPNSTEGGLDAQKESVRNLEIRAIRNIGRGEEITKCYEHEYLNLFCSSDTRKTKIKQNFRFDCKCQYCANPDQEDITKKLFKLHTALAALELQEDHQKTLSDWAKEAKILGQIVNLNQECYVGGLDHKWRLAASLIRVAYIAGKQDLVKMAMDVLKNLADVTKVEIVRGAYERKERDLIEWSGGGLLSIETTQKEEIDRTWYDVD